MHELTLTIFKFADTFQPFDDMVFPMPNMLPRGRGGHGRGRGVGRGCPRMGRGGMGRPDPRWRTFGGPHGRTHPRQVPFESWSQSYGGFDGFGRHSYIPWTGPQSMWGPWEGHFDMAGPPRMPFGGPCGGRGGGRPLNPWRLHKLLSKLQETCDDIPSRKAENMETKREDQNKDSEQGTPTEHCSNMEHEETPEKQHEDCCHEEHMRTKRDFGPHHFNRSRFMRRLRHLLTDLVDTSDSSSDSDGDQLQDATNEDKNHDSDDMKLSRKEYHQAWRRFMRRQMHACPPHTIYGGGPPQAWLPSWVSPVPAGPTPSQPMGPRPLLHKLRRLLTALEAETGHQTEDGKDQATKTSEASDSTHRQARLQARLRRLIDHIEHKSKDNFAFRPVHPGMPWMRVRPGCRMMPCHRRQMFKHMPFGGPRGNNGCGRPLNPCRFRKLLNQMQETGFDTPSSNAENDEAHCQDKTNSDESGDGSNMEDTETKDKQSAECCQEGHFRNKSIFGPHFFGRPRFMRRLRRLVSQMKDTDGSGGSSDSESVQLQDATNEGKTRDSEKINVPRKECRRAWRRFMHRQMHGCPRAFYGGGPEQAWMPTWVSPVPCGPTQARPMVPPPMLHKLRRLLTAMGVDHQTEDRKDQENKTSSEKDDEAADSTHRQARLHARLRRLIDHIENQSEDDFPSLPPHLGMLRMRGGLGCGMMPRHRRRIMKHMRNTKKGNGETLDQNTSGKDNKEPENATKQVEESSNVITNHGPLEDWHELRQDVEDLEAEQGVPLVTVPESCPTCGCSATAQID